MFLGQILGCESARPRRHRWRDSSSADAARQYLIFAGDSTSKYHCPAAFFISGMGNASFCAPTIKSSLPSLSFRQRFIPVGARKIYQLATLSSVGSPVERISFDSGPRLLVSALVSSALAASAQCFARVLRSGEGLGPFRKPEQAPLLQAASGSRKEQLAPKAANDAGQLLYDCEPSRTSRVLQRALRFQ